MQPMIRNSVVDRVRILDAYDPEEAERICDGQEADPETERPAEGVAAEHPQAT